MQPTALEQEFLVSRLGILLLLAAAFAALLVIAGVMDAPRGFGMILFAVAAFLFLLFLIAEIFHRKE